MRNNSKMMKAFLAACLTMMVYMGHAQVEWSFSAVKKNDSLVEIHLKASLSEGWHIYSTDTSASPFPTRIVFQPGLSLSGALRELGQLSGGGGKDGGLPIRYYTGTVEFIQTVKMVKTGGALQNVQGTVEYVICTEEQCLPPEKKTFSCPVSRNG